MSKGLFFGIVLILVSVNSSAQEIAGIHVGESVSALDTLNLKPTAKTKIGSMETVKYTLASGNELSVTYDGPTNRIVYLECDWNRNSNSATRDLPEFIFGTTTLDEIRRTNGSNGFSYKSNAMFRADPELVTFNDYHIENEPGLVVAFVTVLNIPEFQERKGSHELDADSIAKNLKLDAVIIAEESYLDRLWGNEKVYDKRAKPISWPHISKSEPR
jgi:hypothetical protein